MKKGYQGKGRKQRTSQNKKIEQKPESTEVRLNRFIANAGICSRREADKLIEAGEIKINNKVVTELGTKVNPGDTVKYQGKIITPEKYVYVLLNKPKDFITTTNDPEDRKTVMQLVSNACEERIYPVGRLDRNTTGLLLFTNDGDLAKKLSHPSGKVKKIYQVDLNKPITEEDFLKIKEGVVLEDGPAQVDDLEIVSPDKS
ncbi:MAG: pseudouridine synthase, partial [Cyclobacteriaceae bacterium]